MKTFLSRRNFSLLIFSLLCSSTVFSQNLVWYDEFDYSGLPDNSKWGYDVMPPGTVNNELQNYTENRLENARVENGNLIIEARRDNYNGHQYSSARLVTREKGDWLYGRVEVKAILPSGRGTWPAIWMLPTDWVYGGWPNSGEIDIMEHVGYDQGVVHASTHSLDYYWVNNNQKTATIEVADCSVNPHVYAMEWSPSKIDMFVDGVLYFTSHNENTSWTAWPFDQRFHLILNIAIGGDWGGIRGVDDRMFPVRMTVDYVRVYNYNAPVDTQVPTTPTELTAKSGSSNLSLSWTASRDNYSVKEYEVYNGNTLVATTIFPNYTLSGLTPLTTYSIKVRARDHAGNLSEFASGTFSTTQVVVVNIPSKIEAEDYDVQFGVQTETTSDEGGGLNVGWIDTGDYLEYVVGASTEGSFTISYRTACLNSPGQVQVKDVNGTVLNTTNIPVTGGWQNWTTVTSEPFVIPSGTSRLRLFTSVGGYNLNWLEFKTAGAGGDTTPPTAPTNLVSTDKTNTTVTLTWNPSTDNIGVVGYNVYTGSTLSGTTSGTNFTVTGLSSNKGYKFSVRAKDAAANLSEASNTITVRTLRTGARIDYTDDIEETRNAIVSAFPNPANDEVRIIYHADKAETVKVSIRNMMFQNLGDKEVNLVKGENIITLKTSNFNDGLLFLSIAGKSTSKIQSIKLQIKH